MSAPPVFVSRLVRLPLVDGDEGLVGRIQDVVLMRSGPTLRVLGLVAQLQRRRIFVNMARITDIDRLGVHLRGGTVDTRTFHPAYIKRDPSKHPAPATGGLGKQVRARMTSISQGLGTTFEARGEDLVLSGFPCEPAAG